MAIKYIAIGACAVGFCALLANSAQPAYAGNNCDYEARRYADSRVNRAGEAIGTTAVSAGLGAAIGAIVDGGSGAGTGAIIGAATGGVGGTVGTNVRWQRTYERAYDDCMYRKASIKTKRRKRTGAPKRGTKQWYRYCKSKYRSFNSSTGTYTTYSGKTRACR